MVGQTASLVKLAPIISSPYLKEGIRNRIGGRRDVGKRS